MTLDDLLALGSNARIEIINGEIIEMNAAGGLHQLIGKNIWKPLDEYVMTEEKDWIFYHYKMRLK